MGKTEASKVLLGGVVAWIVLVAEQAAVQYGWEVWMGMQVEAGLMPAEVLRYVRQPEQFNLLVVGSKLLGALILSYLCAAIGARPGARFGAALIAGVSVWAFMFFMATLPGMVMWPFARFRMGLGAAGDLAGYVIAAALAGLIHAGLPGRPGGTRGGGRGRR